MKSQLILKLGNFEHKIKFNKISTDKKYYVLLEIIRRSLLPLKILIIIIYITLLFHSVFFTGIGQNILGNPFYNSIAWTILFLILMFILQIIKILISPKDVVQIFKFDTALMLFVSITTLINLFPFFANQLGINNDLQNNLTIKGILNFSTFSGLSLIILLFSMYFVITNIQKLKKNHLYILISNLVTFSVFLDVSNLFNSFKYLVIYSLLLLAFVCRKLLPKRIVRIYLVGLLLVSFYILTKIPVSNLISQYNIFASLIFFVPILISNLISHKKSVFRFNILLTLWFLLINIKSGGNILYILFPFLISLFATLIFLTISQKKKVKTLIQKFKKLFEKDRTLILSTFDIAYILISILTVILVLFLGSSILKNSNNIIELFEYFILDINRIFATNKNALYWLFGLSFIELPQTLFTLIFSNYGIIGLWSFILLNTYVISRSIALLKNIKINSVKYFSLILTLISFATLIIYGVLVKWNSTLFLSWWLIIALLSLFTTKHRKSNLSKNTEEKIFKLERFGEVIYYISEVLRFSIIIYLVYLLINIISKTI